MNNHLGDGKEEGCPGSAVASGDERPRATKRRRQRTKFDAKQVAKLQASFARDPYPDIDQREEIGKEIGGVEEGRVATWFQNRRARHLKAGEEDQGRKAKKPRSGKRVTPQSQAGVLPPATEGTTEGAAGQPSWIGHFGSNLQLGQAWPSQNHHLSQGYDYGSSQATAFNNSFYWSPNGSNSPYYFGGGTQDCSWRPQQQRQPDCAPWDSGFHFSFDSNQGQAYPIEGQQLGGQASVVQDSMMNTGQITDIITSLEEDGGWAVPSTPGSSPALPGDMASMKQSQNPAGTSSTNNTYLPSMAQWSAYPQWGSLPGQGSPFHWQIHQDPFEMAHGNITHRQQPN